jgi:hypothetical protein
MNKCKNCGEKDTVLYSKYTSGNFCSKECARTYPTKEKRKEINEKVREKLIGIVLDKNCLVCNTLFSVRWNKKDQKTCSRSCADKIRNKSQEFREKAKENGRKGGLNSKQGKRSKNEIYFANFCKEKFHKVLVNEPIFNGWDADVIVEDFKIAVLWNGKWHYEKITESHSLKQVQNRDKIKIKEITNFGYKPYVIKDMGKENKDFVKNEFEKFLKYLTEQIGDSPDSIS